MKPSEKIELLLRLYSLDVFTYLEETAKEDDRENCIKTKLLQKEIEHIDYDKNISIREKLENDKNKIKVELDKNKIICKNTIEEIEAIYKKMKVVSHESIDHEKLKISISKIDTKIKKIEKQYDITPIKNFIEIHNSIINNEISTTDNIDVIQQRKQINLTSKTYLDMVNTKDMPFLINIVRYLENLKKEKDILSLKATISAINSKNNHINNRFKQKINLLREKYNTFAEKNGKLIQKYSDINVNIERNDVIIKTYEEKKKTIDTYQNELSVIKMYLSIVDKKQLPLRLLDPYLEQIEIFTNNILESISDLSIKFENIDDCRTMELLVYRDNKINRNISTFQEGAITTAMRYSFIQTCQVVKSNFFVIDESEFGSWDQKNIKALPKLLDIFKDKFDFILFISHIQQIQDCCDHKINIYKDNKTQFSHINNNYKKEDIDEVIKKDYKMFIPEIERPSIRLKTMAKETHKKEKLLEQADKIQPKAKKAKIPKTKKIQKKKKNVNKLKIQTPSTEKNNIKKDFVPSDEIVIIGKKREKKIQHNKNIKIEISDIPLKNDGEKILVEQCSEQELLINTRRNYKKKKQTIKIKT